MNPDRAALLALASKPDFSPMPVLGSPLASALDARLLSVDLDQRRVEIVFRPGQVFTQASGVLQGGTVCSMLDFALAFAALTAVRDGQSVATASLSVSFLQAAKVGELRATGRVDRAGKQVIFAMAELYDDQRLLATASSVLSVINTFEITR